MLVNCAPVWKVWGGKNSSRGFDASPRCWCSPTDGRNHWLKISTLRKMEIGEGKCKNIEIESTFTSSYYSMIKKFWGGIFRCNLKEPFQHFSASYFRFFTSELRKDGLQTDLKIAFFYRSRFVNIYLENASFFRLSYGSPPPKNITLAKMSHKQGHKSDYTISTNQRWWGSSYREPAIPGDPGPGRLCLGKDYSFHQHHWHGPIDDRQVVSMSKENIPNGLKHVHISHEKFLSRFYKCHHVMSPATVSIWHSRSWSLTSSGRLQYESITNWYHALHCHDQWSLSLL